MSSESILFQDFKAEYQAISESVQHVFKRVMESGWFVLGPECEQFEKQFANTIESEGVVGVASGTDAITLGLMSCGVQNGDEVITTSVTAFPTIIGIERAGAIPVVVDISLDTGLINIDLIESAITDKTKAIVPVHLYGQACDMTKICQLASKYNLKIVEDCAQAVGTRWNGKHVGTFGDVGAFSFYPTKNLGAYGDGGAVCFQDTENQIHLKQLRNYGQTNRYHHDAYGINSRLDELQAAFLSMKLDYLPDWIKRRRAIAKQYRNKLPQNILLSETQQSEDSYHLFIVRCEKRDALMTHLKASGVQSHIHYPIPVHEQAAFRWENRIDCTQAKTFCSQILSLPIHPFLTDTEVSRIIDAIHDFL